MTNEVIFNEVIFKEDDQVYYPALGNEVYTLKNAHLNPNNPNEYILTIGDTGVFIDTKGRMFADKLPKIYHATHANRSLLMQLYGIELEKPSTKNIGSAIEIIQYLLTKQKYVPCYVSDDFPSPYVPDDLDEYENIDLITGYDASLDVSYSFIGLADNYRYAVPFDIATGKAIAEIDDE